MSTLITFKAGDKTPITKNFTRNEFQCSCGCSAQMVDEMLVQKLQTIRTVYDTPLKITSGYRCVKHNAAVGGAKSSKHLYGIAAEDAASGEDAVVYLTGEFFADGLALPDGVAAADIEVALRNIGIFLK